MFAVILSWIILFFIFLSFGDMAITLWSKIMKERGTYSIIDRVWIGVCTIGVILLYLSIFSPINIWMLICIVLMTITYLVLNTRRIKKYFQHIKSIFSQYSLIEKAILLLPVVVILIYSICVPLIYDEGLYHLQTMQWTEQYKAVLGLGNIHGRLGFNSSFLLLSTLFDYHPSHYPTFFSVNSFCLVLLSIWLSDRIIKSRDILHKAVFLFVLVTSVFSLGANISSTSTDILPNILIIYLLLNWTLRKKISSMNSLTVFLIPIFCITLKLSSALILLLPFIYIINQIKNRKTSSILYLTSLSLILVAPWIVRFIILTGYLVYPFPHIDIFSVDWKIPLNMVVLEKEATYAWARIPDFPIEDVMSLSFIEWLPIWIKKLSTYNMLLYASALITVFFILFPKIKKHYLTIWTIAFSGILFSLFTAPDFRFTFGFIICAIAVPLLSISTGNKLQLNNLNIFYSIVIVPLLAIFYIASSQVCHYQKLSDSPFYTLVYKPQPINLLKPEILFDEHKINNITIFTPIDTNQCFEQSLPCAPYYNSNIEMRGNDIGDGFRIKKIKK